MLVTKKYPNRPNISKSLSIHFVSNIRHQHRCDPLTLDLERKPFESSIFYVDNDGSSWPWNSLCVSWSNGETTSTAWFWNSVSFHMELNCISKWTERIDYFLGIFINSNKDFDINNDDNIIGVDMVVFWTRAPFTGNKAPSSGRNWTDSIAIIKTLHVWIRIVLKENRKILGSTRSKWKRKQVLSFYMHYIIWCMQYAKYSTDHLILMTNYPSWLWLCRNKSKLVDLLKL